MSKGNIVKSEQGSIVVEFALLAPLMLILMAVLLEAARMLYHSSTIEKHLYIASEIAAHSALPLDLESTTRITNMAQRGNVDGTGDFLVPGWGEAGADLDILLSYYDLNGEPVPVITLNSSVPYVPILEDLSNAIGLNDTVLEHSHVQIIR